MSFIQQKANAIYSLLHSESESFAVECLLNCYIRELAVPGGYIEFDYQEPTPLKETFGAIQDTGKIVCLHIGKTEVIIGARKISRLDRCQFSTPPYVRDKDGAWIPLRVTELANVLLTHHTIDGFAQNLIRQIENSVLNTRLFLHEKALKDKSFSSKTSKENYFFKRKKRKSSIPDIFIASEQNQVWGHALHPAPKSRDGVDEDELIHCSPEVGAAFQLFWFEVAPTLKKNLGSCQQSTLDKLSGEKGLYPCHPWEVKYILDLPAFNSAWKKGLIKPAGFMGEKVYPTSSVRTVYHPELEHFLKFSIHVRLTNCIRKNAWYELESAVNLTQLLKPVMEDISSKLSAFTLMQEPSATTLGTYPLLGNQEENIDITESFGILYRETIPPEQRDILQPQVAMALFTWNYLRKGESQCKYMLDRLAEAYHQTRAQIAVEWLKRYAQLLCEGVLRYHLEYGVILEPHLQNTVIGFDKKGFPAYIWVRDLEGTKLLTSHWREEQLPQMNRRTRQSVWYASDKGWQRTIYCLLVNNLAEAIFHLSLHDNGLEEVLWEEVHTLLLSLSVRLHDLVGDGNERLHALCKGVAFPAKANLLTRLNHKADRDASYIQLATPFAVNSLHKGDVA